MPRNPHKTHCQVSGCRAWAMRGHTRCRAHRDAELGPRGAGAPRGNLNALQRGHYSHPLPSPDLERMAAHIVDQPADLPLQIGFAAQSIQTRTGDPLMTLIALRRLLSQLVPLVATRLLAAELPAFLQSLPPSLRGKLQAMLHRSVPRDTPESTVLLLRRLRKTIIGTGQLPELGLGRRQVHNAALEPGTEQLPEQAN